MPGRGAIFSSCPDAGRVVELRWPFQSRPAAQMLECRQPGASVHHRHRAPVLRPGLLSGSADRRAFLAVAESGDTVGGDAAGGQVVLHRGGAAVAQRQIVFARAALVGVAFDRHADIAVLLEPLGLPVQGRARFGAEIDLIVAEEDAVADIGREVLLGTGTTRNIGAAIHRPPSAAGASRTTSAQCSDPDTAAAARTGRDGRAAGGSTHAATAGG